MGESSLQNNEEEINDNKINSSQQQDNNDNNIEATTTISIDENNNSSNNNKNEDESASMNKEIFTLSPISESPPTTLPPTTSPTTSPTVTPYVQHGTIYINNKQVTKVTQIRGGYSSFIVENNDGGVYWDYSPSEKLNFDIQVRTPDKHLYITSIILVFV